MNGWQRLGIVSAVFSFLIGILIVGDYSDMRPTVAVTAQMDNNRCHWEFARDYPEKAIRLGISFGPAPPLKMSRILGDTATRWTRAGMISRFRHKGLERFFKAGDHRGISAQDAARIERILDRLDSALPALRMTQTEFARRLGVSRLTVSELLLEKRGLSPEIAARIGRLLDTTPESWLRMQEALDLWQVNQHPEKLTAIQPIKAAA